MLAALLHGTVKDYEGHIPHGTSSSAAINIVLDVVRTQFGHRLTKRQ